MVGRLPSVDVDSPTCQQLDRSSMAQVEMGSSSCRRDPCILLLCSTQESWCGSRATVQVMARSKQCGVIRLVKFIQSNIYKVVAVASPLFLCR